MEGARGQPYHKKGTINTVAQPYICIWPRTFLLLVRILHCFLVVVSIKILSRLLHRGQD